LLDGEQPTLFLDDPASVAGMILGFLCDGVEPAGAIAVAAQDARPAPPALPRAG